MTSDFKKASSFLSREDYKAVLDALLQWRDASVEDPAIPYGGDLDGDGTADAFKLDENDEVILVPDISIRETVAASVGDSVEVGEKLW